MKEAGFQLVDLTLTLLVLMVLAGLAGPLLSGVSGRQNLEYSSRLTLSALTKARTMAVSKSAPVQLQIQPGGAAIGLSRPGQPPSVWKPLPSGVRIIEAPRLAMVFHSRGNVAPAGSLTLQSGSGRVRIVVSPAGRLRREVIS